MRGSKFLVLAILLISIEPYVVCAAIPIIEIADTSTLIPNGSEDFTSFGIPSSDRDNSTDFLVGSTQYFSNSIYFTAQGANGLSGVYVAIFPSPGITEISTIADTTMTAPTGGKFANFSNTTSGFREVGFIAADSNSAQGAYILSSGGPYLIATSATYSVLESISVLDDGPSVIRGEIESRSGIYTFDPLNLSLVANTSIIPSGASTPFTSFGPISFKGGSSAIENEGYAADISAMSATVNNVQGIYFSRTPVTASPNFQKLADTNTPVPNGSGDFTSFGNPVATASFIEFTASYSSSTGPQQGIFIYGPYLHGTNAPLPDSPKLQELLAGGMVAPDSNGAHFTSFLAIGNNENLGGDGIADVTTYIIPFLATLDNSVEGLYCTTGFGTSVKILDTGDILNGKTVSGLTLSPDAAGYVFTAFGVDFTDGSSGIYYFDTNVLPEPVCLTFPLACGLFVGRRRQ